MARMPHEPEAFAEQVASMLRRFQPEHTIQIVGPRELIVDGRTSLDLTPLRASRFAGGALIAEHNVI